MIGSVPTALLTRLLGRLPIGWLQLSHNRGRLAAALGGVAFANLLVFMQLGFLGAILGSVDLSYQTLDADILISASDMNALADGGPLPRQRMYEALSVPGVKSVTPLMYGHIEWKQPDGTVRNLDVFGVDPLSPAFNNPELENQLAKLALPDAALLDRRTRNVSRDVFASISKGQSYVFEVKSRQINVLGTFEVGGGFSADGYLIVSDQTFLKLFPQRSSNAPNQLLVKLSTGFDALAVSGALNAAFSAKDSRALPKTDVIAKDKRFQTTQKPVGLIFGFGVVIGVLVGMVIVYQILSSDVADHLREYATLKAVGYGQKFFLSIVMEEALILALGGFVPGFLISSALYVMVANKTALPLTMDVSRPIYVFVGTLLMCALSGALATRKLAKANPADLF
jgi:putative ABC transport system permease protein